MSHPSARPASIGEKQLREAEEAFRRDRLAPFADQIHFVLRALRQSLLPTRMIERLIVVSKTYALQRYLENYVLEHDELPSGRVQLRYGGDHVLKEAHPFDVDLDALAAMLAREFTRLALPRRYRLARDQRARFFKPKIEALVSAFDPRFLVQRGPDGEGLFWLEAFLRHYVEDYERLPRGRMRATSSQMPVSASSWYDFGEVDFDALRDAARVAEGDVDACVHSRADTSS